VDVRVVAATHRDLRAEVSAGRFREDLFYRLEMITMDLPPLRERLDDLPLLVTHLLEREGRRLRRKPPRLTAEALAVLRTHAWPGNVRELANVLARAMLLTDGREIIDAPDLSLPAAAIGGDESAATLEEAERALIRRTLAAVPTRKEAAARLGIALSTLYEKMRKYGIE
jgi:two-component system response regulator HydG